MSSGAAIRGQRPGNAPVQHTRAGARARSPSPSHTHPHTHHTHARTLMRADLKLLRHDKPLAATAAGGSAPHLKHVPAYLRDPSLQGASLVGGKGERGRSLVKRGCVPARAGHAGCRGGAGPLRAGIPPTTSPPTGAPPATPLPGPGALPARKRRKLHGVDPVKGFPRAPRRGADNKCARQGGVWGGWRRGWASPTAARLRAALALLPLPRARESACCPPLPCLTHPHPRTPASPSLPACLAQRGAHRDRGARG